MIPFDMKAPDLHKRENEIGMKLLRDELGSLRPSKSRRQSMPKL
jgi:hypothetical protein